MKKTHKSSKPVAAKKSYTDTKPVARDMSPVKPKPLAPQKREMVGEAEPTKQPESAPLT